MRNQCVKALSISRPLFDMMKREHLAVQVLANYPSTGSGHCRRACNLVTSEGEIIALVGPAIGNGPLNIVIEETGILDHVKPGWPAVFSNGQLILRDSLVVLLDEAQLWGGELNWECLPTQQRRLKDNLAALCDWLSQNDIADGLLGLVLDEEKEPGVRGDGTRSEVETASPQNRAFLTMAQAGIEGLMRALQDGDRSGIRENAARLAGLGPGLTPAGDDYLVGLMAGLRVWLGPLENTGLSPDEACQIILEATKGRTTLLSRAFLRSGKEGLFGENWHELLAELARGETIRIQRAARHILSSGATSGADALAGFMSPYLWHRSGDFSRANSRDSRVRVGGVVPVQRIAGRVLRRRLGGIRRGRRLARCLTARAKVSPPPAYFDPLDGRRAGETGLPFMSFDLKALLIGSPAPVQVQEGHLRRATQLQPPL